MPIYKTRVVMLNKECFIRPFLTPPRPVRHHCKPIRLIAQPS